MRKPQIGSGNDGYGAGLWGCGWGWVEGVFRRTILGRYSWGDIAIRRLRKSEKSELGDALPKLSWNMCILSWQWNSKFGGDSGVVDMKKVPSIY